MANLNLKQFLKLFTAVNNRFIDSYYKFYEMCENNKFGIDVEDIINYLEISKRDMFYKRLRDKYIENIDYIVINNNKQKKEGVRVYEYYVTLDTFEKICMSSHTEKANQVRSYFIILRKFINYYKSNITDAIISKIKRNKKCVYIILVNKKSKIFKIGKTEDIRKRLRTYATGLDHHPDIKFILLVDNPNYIEACAKSILSEFEQIDNHEIYKVDIDYIKSTIFRCIELQHDKDFFKKKNNVDAYVIFDDMKK